MIERQAETLERQAERLEAQAQTIGRQGAELERATSTVVALGDELASFQRRARLLALATAVLCGQALVAGTLAAIGWAGIASPGGGQMAWHGRYGWGRGPGPDILTLIGAVVVIVAVLRALGLW